MVDAHSRVEHGERPQWLSRHRLLWIAPYYHERVTADVHDAHLRATVAAWLRAGWPVVVRRQMHGFPTHDHDARIAVGMPLCPAANKTRVALTIAPAWIARAAPPPALAGIIPLVSSSWRERLRRLAERATEIDVALHVYGSLAWEALTRTPYLTGDSDVDLLWRPTEARQLDAGVAMLAEWEAESGTRADGEILFGDDAVAWREWRRVARDGTDARVLVKTIIGPRLARVGDLCARLPAVEGRIACEGVA
jgi:phosphoribosyl-dephospho-CoA transferase